jgi:hypothetical protein
VKKQISEKVFLQGKMENSPKKVKSTKNIIEGVYDEIKDI